MGESSFTASSVSKSRQRLVSQGQDVPGDRLADAYGVPACLDAGVEFRHALFQPQRQARGRLMLNQVDVLVKQRLLAVTQNDVPGRRAGPRRERRHGVDLPAVVQDDVIVLPAGQIVCHLPARLRPTKTVIVTGRAEQYNPHRHRALEPTLDGFDDSVEPFEVPSGLTGRAVAGAAVEFEMLGLEL